MTGALVAECLEKNAAMARALQEHAAGHNLRLEFEGREGMDQFLAVQVWCDDDLMCRICVNCGVVTKVVLGEHVTPVEGRHASAVEAVQERLADLQVVLDAAQRAETGPPINLEDEEEFDEDEEEAPRSFQRKVGAKKAGPR